MPPSSQGRGNVDGGASPEVTGDGIDALPDDVLHHVLSFLPAEEAVRTCVLARRWRHLWKSATGLRIGCADELESPYGEGIREFVNHLLLLRKRDASIHSCEIRFRWYILGGDMGVCLNLWIRHVLDRGAQVLKLDIEEVESPELIDLDNLPLVSQHLTTLELSGVSLSNGFSNFSSCPNLQHLQICASVFSAVEEISSKSLKRLSIGSYCFFDVHTRICTPNLVSLKLDAHFRSVPVLGSMPSLKEAFVRNTFEDCCDEGCFSCDYCGIPDGHDYNRNESFLLQGLSEAENLTMSCDYDGFVFHRDLEWCPTFNKLRVLVMNDWWFVQDDFYGLNCILKHSPVLENLTLYLFSERDNHKVEIIGRYHQMERSATISKHLKAIEVKCEVVDKKVHKLLKFLGTFGIHFLFK